MLFYGGNEEVYKLKIMYVPDDIAKNYKVSGTFRG